MLKLGAMDDTSRKAAPGGARRHAPAGFTIMELALVVAVMAHLAAIGVIGYGIFRQRALAAEVKPTLYLIADAQRAMPGGPIPCAPSPPFIPTDEVRWQPSEGFERLGLRPGPQVRYQYEVQVEPDGRFVVIARGDLDADGETSEYRLWSHSGGISTDKPWE